MKINLSCSSQKSPKTTHHSELHNGNEPSSLRNSSFQLAWIGVCLPIVSHLPQGFYSFPFWVSTGRKPLSHIQQKAQTHTFHGCIITFACFARLHNMIHDSWFRHGCYSTALVTLFTKEITREERQRLWMFTGVGGNEKNKRDLLFLEANVVCVVAQPGHQRAAIQRS